MNSQPAKVVNKSFEIMHFNHRKVITKIFITIVENSKFPPADDTPVIAQFASNLEHEYLSCAEMIYPYVDGIDLNCGCPQSWAMRSGYGSAMLKKPELISSLTSAIRRNLPNDFSVSVKVRIQKDLSYVSQNNQNCRKKIP